jgi:predicted nucleic acid-binding protein
VADYLLDSSFLIGYFNEVAQGKIGPARRFRAQMPARSRLFFSLVSLAELLEGADDPAAVERELGRLARCLGLSQQHARRVALMQRRAREHGTRLGENDAWIAVTAALAGLSLVGDDDRAFAHRPSVSYLNFRTGSGA